MSTAARSSAHAARRGSDRIGRRTLEHQVLAVAALRRWLAEVHAFLNTHAARTRSTSPGLVRGMSSSGKGTQARGRRPAAVPGAPENVFLHMPTGAGKTFTAVDALAEVIDAGRPVLWIAHSSTLLSGAEKTLRARFPALSQGQGVPGLVPALGRLEGPRKDIGARVCLAMAQTLVTLEQRTLLAHLDALDEAPIVIWDEFHHAIADSWIEILDRLRARGLPVLGLSATPMRSSAEGTLRLRREFPKAVFRVGMQELIDARVLARPKIHSVRIDGPRLSWTTEERRHLEKIHDVPPSVLNRLAAQAVRNKKILATYHSLAQQGLPASDGALHHVRKCVIFCCSKDHARHLADLFRRSGVAARDVCDSARKPENVAAIEAFKDPNSGLDILTSVVLLSEGVDLPLCDTVMIARPTRSPIFLQQMIGRAMRGPEVEGTESCLVVDFVDTFENMHDVAASTVAFMRGLQEAGHGAGGPGALDELLAQLDELDHERRGARTPTRPRTAEQRRAAERAFATLLALRDYLWQHYGDEIDPEVVAQDISHVIQWFDASSEIDRVFVVPKSERDRFEASIHALAAAVGDLPEEARTPIREATLARQVHAEHFPVGSKITEDDFAAAATAAIRSEARSSEDPRAPTHDGSVVDVRARMLPLTDAIASLHVTGLAAGVQTIPDAAQRYGHGLLDLVSSVDVVPPSVVAANDPGGVAMRVVTAPERAAWAKLPARAVLDDPQIFSYCMHMARLTPGQVAQRISVSPRRRLGLVFPSVFEAR